MSQHDIRLLLNEMYQDSAVPERLTQMLRLNEPIQDVEAEFMISLHSRCHVRGIFEANEILDATGTSIKCGQIDFLTHRFFHR